MTTVYIFLSGGATLGFCVCSLIFLRFWSRTRDQLFIAFALAFAFLGIGQAILVLANIPTEDRENIYLIRLAAFTLILVAILRKNTARA